MGIREWINHKLGFDITPDNFLEVYVSCLEGVIKCFNQKDFPTLASEEISELVSVKGSFSRVVFNNTEMRTNFQDFLMDMETALNTFIAELKVGRLVPAAQRKDFVGAREAFRRSLQPKVEPYTESLGRF